MKALITGMNGTVAPALARCLEAAGHEVIAWNRLQVAIDDFDAIRQFIASVQPDCFFHVATGDPEWARMVAAACTAFGVRFIFTSSVSVYAHTQHGVFTPDIMPEPNDDYGRYKLECEQLVRAANPQAIIARLAWQIAPATDQNTMMRYFKQQVEESGTIKASVNWYPACAFLEDTAASLMQLAVEYPAGLYHLDANPGWNFYEIASHVNRLYATQWQVDAVDQPAQHNLMHDPHIQMRSIVEHFTHLDT